MIWIDSKVCNMIWIDSGTARGTVCIYITVRNIRFRVTLLHLTK